MLADAIVELTETGSSLRANNLRIVEDVLISRTKLIANPSFWAPDISPTTLRKKICDYRLKAVTTL